MSKDALVEAGRLIQKIASKITKNRTEPGVEVVVDVPLPELGFGRKADNALVGSMLPLANAAIHTYDTKLPSIHLARSHGVVTGFQARFPSNAAASAFVDMAKSRRFSDVVDNISSAVNSAAEQSHVGLALA